MRYIKIAFGGLLILFILLTLIGLLMPSSVTVFRSVEIHAPADTIHYYTNNIAHWKYWINGADTAYFKQLTPSSTDKDATVVLGSFTITIISANPKHITTFWKGSSGGKQLSYLELRNNPNGVTLINWSFQQQLAWYPWERLSAMLHDKVFGPSMEVSLAKLKRVCERAN
ncbi:SRPBCC family protein [Parafilimonas sp.]|uniref:SRPBCC family protein n=1 Tax=Parafilimonas sp. TaxID=1969739 RepID=UPI0039E6DCBA